MQNISLDSVFETGVLPLGCSPSVPQGFVDLIDLAEVARIVIFSPLVHNFASYELVGQNLPYSAVAKIIQEEIGKPVDCLVLPAKEFAERIYLAGAMHGEFSQGAAESMIVYLNRWEVYPPSYLSSRSADFMSRGLTGNTNILGWLLGREPTTWNQRIRRELTS
jgi:hypothetical protein